MKQVLPLFLFMVSLLGFSGYLLCHDPRVEELWSVASHFWGSAAEEEEEIRTDSPYERWLYDFNLLKDPVTGHIPRGIRQQELALARSIPFKGQFYRTDNPGANTYTAAGPINIGGRTRAVAYDVRNNGVILAGGVNGGIYRSTDGGNSWNWMNTPDINSVTTIAQDPRPGFQDTWYCGTGEFIPSSAITGPTQADLSFIVGYGMFVSKDNGVTWTPLQFSRAGDINQFDNAYDIINKLVVNPANGDLYVSRFGQIVRVREISPGNYVRQIVLGPKFSFNGLTTTNQISDITINSSGTKFLVAFHGDDTLRSNADTSKMLEGIWESSTGDSASWTKIAGADIKKPIGWDSAGKYGRIVIALAPSNEKWLYVMYDNNKNGSKTASGGPQPEANLFKVDMTSGNANTYQWTNLSANLPKTDPSDRGALQVQNGYDMCITIKPDDPNTVFIGGVNAYRSTSGFTDSTHTVLINGYARKVFDANAFSYYHDIGHPDQHLMVFRPGSSQEMIFANDGGLQKTLNVNTPDSIVLAPLNNNYQTVQYYYVAIDPANNTQNFLGGAQDNHCTFRNGLSTNPNSHDTYIVGDGGSVGISQVINNKKYLFISGQNNNAYRITIDPATNQYAGSFISIKPSGIGNGNFITLFYLNPDNNNDLYLSSKDTIFRSTNAVSGAAGISWSSLPGLHSINAGNIRSFATTRGAYNANHNLFIGTDKGKVYRLKDPRNADPSAIPVDITPPGMSGVVIGLAVNPRNDDTLMAVVSNYGVAHNIFWTGNANAPSPTWQTIEGNLVTPTANSGFTGPSIRSCAIVAKQNGVEYYVGTSIGLYSTNSISSNNTFWVKEVNSGPLANAIVSSLALRWSDNTLVVGTHGNGMYYASIGSAAVVTATPDVIRNDKSFIRRIYPTLTAQLVNIEVGNYAKTTSMNVVLYNALGQVSYWQQMAYENGAVDVSLLPSGVYVMAIWSNDRKQLFIQKIIRQ